MAKHAGRSSPPVKGRPLTGSGVESTSAGRAADSDESHATGAAAQVGERLRRVSLGLASALLTARAFWPSEPDLKEWGNSGLSWVLLLLLTFGLGLAGSLIGGRFRFRWSWIDAAVIALMVLVAMSATHAIDRRPAINLAWEWTGFGLFYVMMRILPRTRAESSAMVAVLIATAVAVSVYGLYQVQVELPLLRAEYVRNPNLILQKLGIEPGGRGEEILRNRLMYSSEPLSTFVLTNSLAGFIVGPLVILLAVGLQNLVVRDKQASPWSALAMAAPLVLTLLVCLILTKSRSAYIGLVIAALLIAWQARGRVPRRLLWAVALAGIVIVSALIAGGLATGRLDREVLTQSGKSFRYRLEFWQGALGVITSGATSVVAAFKSPVFWFGVGPGNFAGPYLRHKLVYSSEDILDPHNLLLEVWATAGLWSMAALLIAIGAGLVTLLRHPRLRDDVSSDQSKTRPQRIEPRRAAPAMAPGWSALTDEPPERMTWLLTSAGLGGWILVVLLRQLDPFEGDLFFRWLILGIGWIIAVVLGAPLWRRLPIPASALGLAFLAVVINLIAAGGIGVPTVALGLWSMLALGLNLCDDRPVGRIRELDSRVPPFVLAVGWAAVMGTFIGTISPFWRAESYIADAQAALAHRPPDFERADASYLHAIDADGYYVRPWRELGNLHFEVWRHNGNKVEDRESRWSWKTVPYLYHVGATPPRNPAAWGIHSERALRLHQILALIGAKLEPLELLKYRGEIVKSTRTATLLNPTNVELHARLANDSADLNMYQDAFESATEALRIDRLTPHPDKKLPPQIRAHLESLIEVWRENAAKMPIGQKP
jgi:O-antigen ligase